MRRLVILCSVFVLCGFASIARAAEPPLAVNAYVRGDLLVITVFADAPTAVKITVVLPPGWSADEPIVMSVNARPIVVRTWHLHPGVGLGIIRVVVSDGRGNHAQDVAYAAGTTVEARPAVGVVRRYLAVVRR